jgi:hypothetical protein
MILKTQKLLFLFFMMLSTCGSAQINNDFLVPHVLIGKGLGDMKEVQSAFGWGYDIGYDLPNNSFGFSLFYNRLSLANVRETLPMYRDKFGIENVVVRNRSTIQTIGLKFRYTPEQLHYERIYPYVEVGIGRAYHRASWRTRVDEASLDYFHLNYYDYVEAYKNKEDLNREQTLIILGEIGFNLRLFAELDSKSERQLAKNRNGWYLGVSMRIESGGDVTFRNPKHNPDHFYFDSGLGNFADNPFTTQSFPFDEERTFANAAHRLVFLQISLMRILF